MCIDGKFGSGGGGRIPPGGVRHVEGDDPYTPRTKKKKPITWEEATGQPSRSVLNPGATLKARETKAGTDEGLPEDKK